MTFDINDVNDVNLMIQFFEPKEKKMKLFKIKYDFSIILVSCILDHKLKFQHNMIIFSEIVTY